KDEALQARMREAYSPLGWLRRQFRHLTRQWNRQVIRQGARLPAAASTGYSIFPLKTFTDLDVLITCVRRCLSKVTAPTVVLQAREDDMSSPRNAYLVYDEIGSKKKDVILLDDCYHVITVDKQKRAVVEHLVDFFAEYTTPRAVLS